MIADSWIRILLESQQDPDIPKTTAGSGSFKNHSWILILQESQLDPDPPRITPGSGSFKNHSWILILLESQLDPDTPRITAVFGSSKITAGSGSFKNHFWIRNTVSNYEKPSGNILESWNKLTNAPKYICIYPTGYFIRRVHKYG